MANSDSAVLWFWVAVAGGILLYAFWDTKLVMAVRLNVDSEHLEIAPKPHDCEFMTAPIGDKHCHYKQVVQKTLHAREVKGGYPIYSSDDGKTWVRYSYELTAQEAKDWPTYPTAAVAWVGWEKVTD